MNTKNTTTISVPKRIRRYFEYLMFRMRLWLRDNLKLVWGHMRHTSQMDEKIRYSYNLNDKSVVFDLGGYKGEWSEKIYTKYGPNIYIFEPIESYFNGIVSKFASFPKIKPFRCGLSGENRTVTISCNGVSSSEFDKTIPGETANLIKADDFFDKQGIEHIDLLKINIEGGEYELLEHLIESGFVKNIDNLQIQFHRFMRNARKRRRNIRKALAKTHIQEYNVPFVWENWKIRE